jgi:hypothetical protein
MRLFALFLALSVAACAGRGADTCGYSSNNSSNDLQMHIQHNQDMMQHNLDVLQHTSDAARMMGIAAGARP